MSEFPTAHACWHRPAAIIALLLIAACSRELPPNGPVAAAPGSASAALATAPVASPIPSPAPVPATAPEPEPKPTPPRGIAACLHKLQLDGRRLAVTWPAKIGQQVALSARVERALDIGQYVIRADGERFLVTAIGGPEAWKGDQLHLFTVIGRGLAHVHGGPQHLPQLMLLDDTACGGEDEPE